MWKTLNHVLPSGSQQKSTSYDFSPDESNTYFSSIGSHLESNFNSDIDMPALDVSFTESFSFGVIPISFITEELLKLRKKSSPDVLGLSGSILSIAAHVIAPFLQVLFCKSLELGYVPNDWKLALVKVVAVNLFLGAIGLYLLFLMFLKLLKNMLI